MRRRGTLKGDVYEMIFGHCCRCISYKGIILPTQLLQGGADWWITSLRSSARARPQNTGCMRAALWEPSAAGAWGPHCWTVTRLAFLSGTGKNTFPWEYPMAESMVGGASSGCYPTIYHSSVSLLNTQTDLCNDNVTNNVYDSNYDNYYPIKTHANQC